MSGRVLEYRKRPNVGINWGTLKIPRVDSRTLGNIRGITTCVKNPINQCPDLWSWTAHPRKKMADRLISFWEGNFQGPKDISKYPLLSKLIESMGRVVFKGLAWLCYIKGFMTKNNKQHLIMLKQQKELSTGLPSSKLTWHWKIHC